MFSSERFIVLFLLVRMGFLWRLKEKNFLRPAREDVALWNGFLMMYN